MNVREWLCSAIQGVVPHSLASRRGQTQLLLYFWGAIALWLSIHSVPRVAQATDTQATDTLAGIAEEPDATPVAPSQGARSSQLSLRLHPGFSIPELPDIQPILPEAQTMRLVLNLGERRVFVYEGDEVKASYPVAVGKPGWETPPGSYQVISMLQDPGWISPFTGEEIPPGPDNPLGDRWIGFWTDGRNYIGFHGTPNRESVGQAASHGCVRMFNEHIRQLYEMVDMGTPVIVEN
ncbi:L,D-transpeptidase [Thermocoleostomius sinensis]|uniref:L,D-transpeptidase n=1 Tax=Thermocoleostomius sinensis A174 TaxID=2016057 RepID=A0A9E9CBN9_9CYAN|nr:L,D-transpeptidase [Thermocoleostomius sinensis]WAL62702.1 L,D-transpeptidase [Thermocoleostomius sinensis A174]